jgi:gliding motility-associated-like protein
MRTLYRASCCFIFLLLPFLVHGQNSPDCFTPIPICADAPYAGLADGGGAEDFDPNVITQIGCLEKGSSNNANIENNSSWYVFRASQDGTIGFDIEALSNSADWDFAVFGPDVQCTDISNGSVQPIRCNYEANVTGYTGLGTNPISGQNGAPNVTGSQNTYDEMIQVRAGEVYYLFINNYNTNFNGDPEPYELTFTGPLVDNDPATALDCTIRDEFLGLNDIIRCEGDPDVILSAASSPAGPNVVNYTWTRDNEDDGIIDDVLLSGINASELTVVSPESARYFVSIETTTGEIISDDILITWYGAPQLNPIRGVEVLDDYLNGDLDTYSIQVNVVGTGDYEYRLNDGDFQDDPVFLDVPAGLNNLVINDKNGCGSTTTEVYVLGYPRFFTPDGTGTPETERWNLRGIDPSFPFAYRLYIYDRYGKLLKQLNEGSMGWDGIFNGRPLPATDYWFRVDFERNDSGTIVAISSRSHFTLKR